jgi:hypothetical protein
MKSLVVHSITKVIRSLRDPKTTLVEYGNVKNRCKMTPVVDIDIIFKNQAGQNRTGKKGFGGGGLRVESCGGWGCGEIGPDGGTTVEGSSSRNWCAQ